MLFQYTIDLVLSGRKTRTSRLVKPGDAAVPGADGSIEAVTLNGRDKYRVGKTYAVQPGRGKPAVARIRLLSIERKVVAKATNEDAKAEGYDSREAFFETWRSIHGADKLSADVWMLTFELVGDATK